MKVYKYTIYFVDGTYIDFESHDLWDYNFSVNTIFVNADNGYVCINMRNVTRIVREEVQE